MITTMLHDSTDTNHTKVYKIPHKVFTGTIIK